MLLQSKNSVFITKGRDKKTEVVKLKAVPLRAKQARGNLEVNSCMSVETFCMLLICTNLLSQQAHKRENVNFDSMNAT